MGKFLKSGCLILFQDFAKGLYESQKFPPPHTHIQESNQRNVLHSFSFRWVGKNFFEKVSSHEIRFCEKFSATRQWLQPSKFNFSVKIFMTGPLQVEKQIKEPN